MKKQRFLYQIRQKTILSVKNACLKNFFRQAGNLCKTPETPLNSPTKNAEKFLDEPLFPPTNPNHDVQAYRQLIPYSNSIRCWIGIAEPLHNQQKIRYIRDHLAYPLLPMFKAILLGQWHSLLRSRIGTLPGYPFVALTASELTRPQPLRWVENRKMSDYFAGK